MKEHNISLTSAELAHLWATYMGDSAFIYVLKYFSQNIEDSQVKPIVERALTYSVQHVEEIALLLKNAKYPVPIGFSDDDVNINAPKLYSDTFVLYFIRNVGKNGLAAYSMAFSMAARKDIRTLFSRYMKESKQLEDDSKETMLSKGTFIRPPFIAAPESADFVDKQGFLKGWFGERRTLSAMEIAHIYLNHQNNIVGKALITGFSQVVESKEIKNYFIKGNELARSIIKEFHKLLEESSLPAPMTSDTEVNNSTIPPFSDKLMLYLVTGLNAISLGNLGSSLALCLRRDVGAKYIGLIKDVGLFAEDGAKIMIKNSWLERPPQALDREHLSKRN